MKSYEAARDQDCDGQVWDTTRIGVSPKARAVLLVATNRKLQFWMASAPPSAWCRFWQWLLLGWRWEVVPEGFQFQAHKYNHNKDIHHG